jgi:hypothetical protein
MYRNRGIFLGYPLLFEKSEKGGNIGVFLLERGVFPENRLF